MDMMMDEVFDDELITEEPQGKDRSRRSERRRQTKNKMTERMNIVKDLGKRRGGKSRRRHADKLDNSAGYMRDGHVSHYAATKPAKKTKTKNAHEPFGTKGGYGKAVKYSPRAQRQIDDMNAQINEEV